LISVDDGLLDSKASRLLICPWLWENEKDQSAIDKEVENLKNHLRLKLKRMKERKAKLIQSETE
jgi:hypothetical protein